MGYARLPTPQEKNQFFCGLVWKPAPQHGPTAPPHSCQKKKTKVAERRSVGHEDRPVEHTAGSTPRKRKAEHMMVRTLRTRKAKQCGTLQKHIWGRAKKSRASERAESHTFASCPRGGIDAD